MPKEIYTVTKVVYGYVNDSVIPEVVSSHTTMDGASLAVEQTMEEVFQKYRKTYHADEIECHENSVNIKQEWNLGDVPESTHVEMVVNYLHDEDE